MNIPVQLELKGPFHSDRNETVHSGWNGMDHLIPARTEWTISFRTEWKGPFHSGQNGMDHFIPTRMEWTILFQPEWKGQFHSERYEMIFLYFQMPISLKQFRQHPEQ